jgi:GntR family transcriptional regulator
VLIVISHANPDPMYKQVTDQVKDAIARGGLEPNAKLPSIREMSKELKLSAITVKRAYFDLEKDGYIVTRAGLGSFVADINKEKIRGEKLAEIRREVQRLVKTGNQFDISADEIIALIREEANNGD